MKNLVPMTKEVLPGSLFSEVANYLFQVRGNNECRLVSSSVLCFKKRQEARAMGGTGKVVDSGQITLIHLSPLGEQKSIVKSSGFA